MEDRAVSGTFGFVASSFDCGTGTTGSIESFGSVVTGRKARNGFELSFGGVANSATASFEIHDEAGAAGAYAHGMVHLECSCDEAVG